MPSPPLQLLRRSQLLPGESLPSLIERLTLLNGYDHSGTILKLCQAGKGQDLILPESYSWLPLMSALTGVTYDDLYAATGYKYANILLRRYSRSSHKVLDGTDTSHYPNWRKRRYFEAGKLTKFCPACLRQAPYHRLLWALNCATACTEHQLLLANSCPRCKGKLKVPEIVRAKCRTCGADLTNTETLSISDHAFCLDSQRVVQSWFLGDAAAVDELPWLLPSEPPVILFQVIADLHTWMCDAVHVSFFYEVLKHDNVAAKDSSPQPDAGLDDSDSWTNYLAWAAAFKGIANWPNGFHELLEAWPTEHGFAPGEYLGERFNVFFLRGENGRWKEPDFNFVREAFVDYINTHYVLSRDMWGRYDYQRSSDFKFDTGS